MTRCGRSPAAARPAIVRYAGRHLGFLAGLLIAGVAFGVAYRYLFDPLDEQTVPFYIRSCIHAMGLTFAGWAVHLTFAAAPRSWLGSVMRRLPLSIEFMIKALTMTAALTIVTVGLQFVLYPFPVSQRWLAEELPLIVGIGFSVSLFVGAIFEFRRMVGGRVLGSFLLGTYHRPRREQRIVMFLDIADSTALAERLGEARVHDLITRFFSDIDQPIADYDGEVHAYVGDEVIVTWPLSEGRRAQCPAPALLLRNRRNNDRARPVLHPGIRRRAAVPRRPSCRSRSRQRVRRRKAADRIFRGYDECRCPAVRALQDRRRNPGRVGRHAVQRCSPAGAERRAAREPHAARTTDPGRGAGGASVAHARFDDILTTSLNGLFSYAA
jgi:class 3 adenylate cyclase